MAQPWRAPRRIIVTGLAFAIALLLALAAMLDDASPQAGTGTTAASLGTDGWQAYYTAAG